MADTTRIKKLIEPYVRAWSSSKFPGHKFEETSVRLLWGRDHKFDAVSEDRTIIAEILSNGARTRGGKENTGRVSKAEGDLLRFFGIDDQTTKLMVFTNAEFLDLIGRRTAGLGVEILKLLHCQLPLELESALESTRQAVSEEQRASVD
jgi:hypothetical protein